ncbi:MAG TPA: sulfatase-like hydrolase/transferase [Kiritimatiellia bacterium]|nr:sulfatase-like hydrolase/transferase [Kiritimatiellia bacterium]HMO97618.1 sulfatase-like hydrolase/transferase [Kiritimatiellia bacterium]HMP95978.1 sulfatase-like hydrolase/transferase [Kiritimatiellia bacterium]
MTQRPFNILWITSDQQHWNTLGSLNPAIKTPNLDRLAAEGTLFTRAYCPNPTCSPTRASMITGLLPSQHGCWALGTKLPEDQPTLGEYLQRAGYFTGLVGKAHFQPLASTPEYPSMEAYPLLQDLEFWRNFHGPFYGFQHVELTRNHADEAHVGQHYALWMEEKGCHNWRDYFRPPTGNNDRQLHTWEIPEEFHYNTWIAERTNALLSECKEQQKPFFLWASFFDPHPDYLVPRPWDTMYDPAIIDVPSMVPGEHDANPPHFKMTQEAAPDFSGYAEPDGAGCHGLHSHLQDRAPLAKDVAIYYGMVSCMDKYIGRIVDHLDALGLAENTLVVFTSDHGHVFGQHGLIRKGPFHYEDLLRVPMIVRQPGTVPAGVVSSSLQSLVDYAPTMLDLAGLPVPRTMSGVSQAEAWRGAAEARRDHVLVEHRHQPTTMFLKTLVEERYKITVYYGRDYGELFDLREDPGEVRNLWDDPAAHDVKARLLLRLIQAQMISEPIWMPRISGA